MKIIGTMFNILKELLDKIRRMKKIMLNSFSDWTFAIVEFKPNIWATEDYLKTFIPRLCLAGQSEYSNIQSKGCSPGGKWNNYTK
jgi:hypothetical protein